MHTYIDSYHDTLNLDDYYKIKDDLISTNLKYKIKLNLKSKISDNLVILKKEFFIRSSRISSLCWFN